MRSVENDQMLIDVIKNDDPDAVQALLSDGFVYFPYYLEIKPIDELLFDSSAYKDGLKTILKAFQEQGRRAVPACDFEEELKEG